MSNENTTDAYARVEPMSYPKFACLAARLSQRAANWAADTCMEYEWTMPEAKCVDRDMMDRFLKEMRGLLDHMDRSVKRYV